MYEISYGLIANAIGIGIGNVDILSQSVPIHM